MSILDICIDLNGQVEMVLTDQEDDQIREGIWLCARVVATRGRSTAQHWAEDKVIVTIGVGSEVNADGLG